MLGLWDVRWIDGVDYKGFGKHTSDPKNGGKSSNSWAIRINCKDPLKEQV
jgi:hypothetical protein